MHRVGNGTALIFVHISKTAGGTLNRVIDWEYKPWRICQMDGRFYFWTFQKVTKWPTRRLAKIQVFKGHMPFGLHKLLPQPSTYITVLRDPIDRMISEYYFRQQTRTHPLAYRSMRGLTLEQYVTTLPYNNVQTKMIAGIDRPYDFYSGECTAEMLDIAKCNLSQSFSLVGVTERFDETLALAKTLFGWRVEGYTSIRQNRGRPKKESIPSQWRDLIAEHNSFDLDLYEFGVSMFDQALAKHAPRVREEIAAIQRGANPKGMRAIHHRLGSLVLKGVTRGFSDLRCAWTLFA